MRRTLAVTAIAVGLAALHVIWLARFRWGYPIDWDEGAYLGIALQFHDALLDGPIAYIEAQQASGPQPPVVTTSAFPLLVLFGRNTDAALATGALWSVLLVVASYGLARRLMPHRWALLAAACVGTAPIVVDYARLFHFALPAAALMTAALWALLESDGLRRTRWVVAAGVLLALMLTARTMTLAFVPGVLLGAAVPLALHRDDRRLRARNLGVLVAVTVVVAALWWVPSWDAVWPYLRGTGYGDAAADYGDQHRVLSAAYWTIEARTALFQLQWPLALALALCLVFAVPRLRRRMPDGVILLVCVVVGGYLALSSTRNQGTAFALPWLPVVVILAVAAAARAPGRVPIALAAMLVVVCGWNVLLKNGVSEGLSKPRYENRWIGVNGYDFMYAALAFQGYAVKPPPAKLPELHRHWDDLNEDMARFVVARVPDPNVGVATGDYMLTETRLHLASVLHLRRGFVHGLVRDATEVGARNVLVTSDPPRRPLYSVDAAAVAAAARAGGLEPARTFRAPDGRAVVVWLRGGAGDPSP